MSDKRLGMMLSKLSQMNRRTFLKLTGGAVAFAATSGMVQATFNALAQGKAGQTLPEKWIATSCLGCLGWCPKLVKVVNGKAVDIKGNCAEGSQWNRVVAMGPYGQYPEVKMTFVPLP